jgi:hypothetical protein
MTSMNAGSSGPETSTDPTSGVRPGTGHPSAIRRFKLPIAGVVLIVISALVLLVPILELGRTPLSVVDGHDLCSAWRAEQDPSCTPFMSLYVVGLLLAGAGGLLVVGGLVRRVGSSTRRVDPVRPSNAVAVPRVPFGSPPAEREPARSAEIEIVSAPAPGFAPLDDEGLAGRPV